MARGWQEDELATARDQDERRPLPGGRAAEHDRALDEALAEAAEQARDTPRRRTTPRHARRKR